ncbi:MAG: hypothetical protein JXR86_17190 [Spirochaetales bacterium]|nr:hypothetical protein [Spirochaetales bacterium]
MPSLQDNLFSMVPSFWELSYPGENGEMDTEEIQTAEGEPVSLFLVKGRTAAVLIQAVFLLEDGKVFRSYPAGFLYPYDCSPIGSGSFSWDEGFLCSVISRTSGYANPDLLNIPRLRALINEKAGAESRWNLDFQVLCDEIAAGGLSYYDVRSVRFRDVDLKLPRGVWANRDVTGTDLISPGSEISSRYSLSTGINLFLGPSGEIAEVHIQTDGSAEYMAY